MDSKRILGLDLGTNSIGWALIDYNFDEKHGEILGLSSRIIPMDQGQLTDFEKGNSISQTADRTKYRGVRRLYQRDNLRRDRLHRVLNILCFLPEHYKNEIDFDKKKGQFKKEVKLNYRQNESGKFEFLFMDSFYEMVKDFRKHQPSFFYTKKNGEETKIPYDWTLYYLRKKALTEKLTKEELAWLILNFNQKRGYYQLRGEEMETQEGKTKIFEVLKVREVVDTGDILKKTGEKLYRVIFENGWEYDKLTTKPENWLNKTKEYIVTTSTTKDGSVKRTYKSVDSEKDWIAIKKKTEQDLDEYISQNSNHTVGTYIYETLLNNPSQKIRGKLIKTIERKYYKQELQKILDKQIELQPELFTKELYQKSILELYPQNEAHCSNIKDKDFKYLLVEDIIFYQRPLKSKKSTIGSCQYEKRPMRDKEGNLLKDDKGNQVYKPIQAISKSNPLYQEFRIWQWIQNLRIYQKYDENGYLIDRDVTSECLQSEQDYEDLFEFLNNCKEVKQGALLKNIFRRKADRDNHRWNYPEDTTYPMNVTRSAMLKGLRKISGVDAELFLTKEIEQKLWHIIYSVKDPNVFEKALKTFARKHNLPVEEFKDAFIKHPPYKNDYGAYSEKAIKKMLPLMRMGRYWDEREIPNEVLDRINKIITGEFDENIADRVREKAIHLREVYDFKGLPVWLVGYIVYNRHSEIGDIQQWKSPHDIDKFLTTFKQHSLRNPIVEQVVLETLRTVRDIWNYYGKGRENFFDEIHIEMGRELKNPAGVRQEISKRNTINQNTNERIRLLLYEMMDFGAKPNSPSHQEILKIYEEGVYQNNINIDDEIEKIRKNNAPKSSDIRRYKLWLEQGYVSPYTGKVIPLSRLFTHEYQIEHIIPQSRYFNNSMSNKVICESSVNQDKSNRTAYEYMKAKGGSIVDGHRLLSFDQYVMHCNKYFKNNRIKLSNLLAEEIPEGFINRQLNDSRYISKLVKSLLGNIVREEEEQEATPKKIIVLTGAITWKLKQDWGLNDKWNELILPRFQRMNELTQTTDFTAINNNGVVIPTVPDELKKGFSKKRIDHRHHALDALVVACCTRKHIQYLNSLNNQKEKYDLQPSLLIKNEQGHYTKYFKMPWSHFPVDAKNALETCIVSFKQNLRVINRTNNKYWKYVDGKKQLVAQKGKNFAIRKSLHKETVSGKLNEIAGRGKIFTAVRKPLSEIKSIKNLEQITDSGIRTILRNHLQSYMKDNGKPDFERAFSAEGMEDLNKNIIGLNNGKKHQPIYKVRIKEEGSKFALSENEQSPKSKKYVEAAKGTNLFFNIYQDQKGQRMFETIPLYDVVEHQKQLAYEGVKGIDRSPVPVKNTLIKGRKEVEVEFLFTLSPNDLVYVPTDEEIKSPDLVDFDHLSREQVGRIYKMVSANGNQCFFIKYEVAKSIKNKYEYSTSNKMEKDIKGKMIKARCWKLKLSRIGQIIEVEGVPPFEGGGSSMVSEPTTGYVERKKRIRFGDKSDDFDGDRKYYVRHSPSERWQHTVELIKRAYGSIAKEIAPFPRRIFFNLQPYRK